MVELQRIYLRKQILVARENGQMTMSGSPGVLTSAIVGMLLWSHNWFRLDGDLDVSSVSNSMVDLVMFGLVTRTPEPLFESAIRGRLSTKTRAADSTDQTLQSTISSPSGKQHLRVQQARTTLRFIIGEVVDAR